MPPIALTENQMLSVLAASNPLPPDLRNSFLIDVAHELAALGTIGDGACHRVIAAVQKKYFRAPLETEEHARRGVSKYA